MYHKKRTIAMICAIYIVAIYLCAESPVQSFICDAFLQHLNISLIHSHIIKFRLSTLARHIHMHTHQLYNVKVIT